jgi:hypothetical protein
MNEESPPVARVFRIGAICVALVALSTVTLHCSEDTPAGNVGQSDTGGIVLNDTSTPNPPTGDATGQRQREGCTSKADCLETLPNLRPCEDAQCMENGDCAVFPISDCCTDADDCPVIEDACIESFCPEPGASCATRSVCAKCQNHADCIEVAEPCEVGWCSEGGRCEFKVLDICCAADQDCQLMDACISSQCIQGRCLYGAVEEGECCDTKPMFTVGFDGDMEFGASSDNPAIFWQVIETVLTPSPPYALYVGNAETMSTATIGDVNAVAIFDVGFMVEGSELDFRSHVYVNLAKTGTQQFQVILTGEGVPEKTLYSSVVNNFDDWHLIHANTPVTKSSNYSVVLRYYQKGSIVGADLGVLVDNLEIRTNCSPYFECFDDNECDDGDPCTVDSCNVGIGTASCVHAPGPPVDGVTEICGDGVDNDCNPETFCIDLTVGDKAQSITPVAKGVSPTAFYNMAKVADADYTASNMLNLLVSEDADAQKAIHLILDKQSDNDGGNLSLDIQGGQGMDILLYDDPPEQASDTWGYDPLTGTGNVTWVWEACCVDGLVLGHLAPNQCITFAIQQAEGLEGVQVWNDAGVSTTYPLSDITLCGDL